MEFINWEENENWPRPENLSKKNRKKKHKKKAERERLSDENVEEHV